MHLTRPHIISLLLILLLAACDSATPTPTLPPAGTFSPAQRDQPTLPPPLWVEPGEEITLANAEQIAYLGRLDPVSSPSTVFAYAFSPESTRLAGLNNEQLIVWNLITGEIVFTTARASALFVYYSANKDEVYTLDSDGIIRIHDSINGREKDSLGGLESFASTAAYYPDEGWLALGGSDGQVKVWDPANRQAFVTLTSPRFTVTGLAFSPDGERLAAATDDGTVIIWNWRDRTEVARFQAAVHNQKLVFSPDGAQIAAGQTDRITLWNAADGSPVFTLDTGPGGVASVLAYSPDGRYVVNGGGIPSMTLWDTITGQLANTLPGVGGDVAAAAFNPGGDLLVTTLLGSGAALWDMSKVGTDVLGRADLSVNTRQIFHADWTPDGFLLLLFEASGPIQVWGIAAPPAPTATP